MGIGRDFDVSAHNARVQAWRDQEAERSARLKRLNENLNLVETNRERPNHADAPKANERTRVVAQGTVSKTQGAGITSGPLTLNAKADSADRPQARSAAASSKYRNKPTNGYASKRESDRASTLRLMQEAGAIRNLQEQVRFLLIPKQDGERACHYVADFAYEEWGLVHYDAATTSAWRPVVEDVKGMKTDVYRIKRKLMQMVHGIKVRET